MAHDGRCAQGIHRGDAASKERFVTNRVAMNAPEAAKMLGISPGTLSSWRGRKEGPDYYKIGRRVIYYEADIERYLESRRRRSSNEEAERRPWTLPNPVAQSPRKPPRLGRYRLKREIGPNAGSNRG